MVTSLEKALILANQHFGLMEYACSKEDVEKFREASEFNEKIRQNLDSEEKLKAPGIYFHNSLRDSVVSYFCKKGRTEEFAASVKNSPNRWRLTYALDEKFFEHYKEQFPEFGEWEPERISPLNEEGIVDAYIGMRSIFNQAENHPRAFVGFSIYVTKYSNFDSGLKAAFEIGYHRIVAELTKRGYRTYRKLPPYITEDFESLLSKTIEIFKEIPQKRTVINKIFEIRDVLNDKHSSAPQKIKENSSKSAFLVDKPSRFLPFEHDDYFFVRETLEEIMDWYEREKKTAAKSTETEIVLPEL